MSNENEKEGMNPTSETRTDVHCYDEAPDLVQLLIRQGEGDDDQYLSNARIEKIASSDTDEEKRQLAARFIQLQLYVKSITATRTYGFKHKLSGNNILTLSIRLMKAAWSDSVICRGILIHRKAVNDTSSWPSSPGQQERDS
ncbi:TPA: hypothetical protein NUX02_004587 [Escherichia coli]|nr:hypothetical protein [Escherichia coli]HCJ5541867.1 hypothetical protein [Escherichia coli]